MKNTYKFQWRGSKKPKSCIRKFNNQRCLVTGLRERILTYLPNFLKITYDLFILELYCRNWQHNGRVVSVRLRNQTYHTIAPTHHSVNPVLNCLWIFKCSSFITTVLSDMFHCELMKYTTFMLYISLVHNEIYQLEHYY